MRIAIDASAMPERLAGAGYYMGELLLGLAQLNQNDEYFVSVGKGADAFNLPQRENWRVNQVKFKPLGRIAWQQTIFRNILRANKIDLLHSLHYDVPLSTSTPYVVTFHDMTFFLYPELHQSYRALYFRMMMRHSARRARKIIADSAQTRQDVIRILNVTPERVETVYPGVSTDFRRIADDVTIKNVRAKYRLPPRFILSVGLIEPRKNLSSLIRAFGQLSMRAKTHALVVVGNKGWGSNQVFEEVEKLGLSDRIVFTGYVPRRDLVSIYNAADLFVYPSLYEGFGMPILEAMACGTPVITSNLSAPAEVAGDSAILVSPTSENELSDAMFQILADRDLRDELSAKGQTRARLFPWDLTARHTISVYRDAIADA